MRTLYYSVISYLFIFIFCTQCAPHYIASNFEAETINHKEVAILPFEMVYTGVKPEELTEKDMVTIEIAESKAFQISYYNEVLRSTRSGRNPIRVNIQDVRKTNNMLNEHNIPIHESWMLDGDFLAKTLDVDAVIKARVVKNRLMSDLASYGIDVAVHILQVISNHTIWPWLPYGVTRSKEIKASYSLIDRDHGAVIWSIAFEEQADWRQRSNDIIDQVNRRSSKNFPYRIK